MTNDFLGPPKRTADCESRREPPSSKVHSAVRIDA